MTGHVRRRGERSWEIKFDLGADSLTGKRRIRYVAFKGTKRAAELELARLDDRFHETCIMEPMG